MEFGSWLISLFTYNSKNPLFFNSPYFWLIFAVVLLGYQYFYNKTTARSIYLFLFSLFIYYKSGGFFFFLILFSSIVDFLIGTWLYDTKDRRSKKLWLILSLTVNLGLLAYFKYSYFLTDTINNILGTDFKTIDYLALFANTLTGTTFNIDKIILPVGISFYTFQTLSYTIDIYRGKLKPIDNFWDFAFYVSFFPQLVAGPIVRASEFLPQIHQKFQLSKEEYGRAIFLIINGLVKKVVIADYIAANFVDRVFDRPDLYSGFENLMAVYGYAMQIYCDFSGYSDIAIGLALLLGFRLPLNFNSPYKAHSVANFWRRWHISLSTWLRDYLYISMGGNRHGKTVMYFALSMTMLLGGLWHGANWKFVIWGALHGGALVVHRLWTDPKSTPTGFRFFLGQFITFQFVCLCWMFFRAADTATVFNMFAQMQTNFGFALIPDMIVGYQEVFGLMLAAYILHFIPQSIKTKAREFFTVIPDFAKAAIIVFIIIGLYQAQVADQPFIYFQF